MKKDYLFVYGTLMQGQHPMHKLLRDHSDFIGHGWITAQLYQIRDYPGVVLSDQLPDKVFGELYVLKDRTVLDKLDDYEECSAAFPEPHEYRREQIKVHISTSVSYQAWVYIYNHPVSASQRIRTGRFKPQ
jgi:gamma-glutamylcyclotransferase (GGCT)/AIG2-like uncharacterized protein YtfP